MDENFTDLFKGLPSIYWINLERHIDRKKCMIELFKKNKITNHTRVSAIDGNEIENFISKSPPKRIATKYEIACTLSHLKVLEEFLKSKQNSCIVFEDDLSLDFCKYWEKPLINYINDFSKDLDLLIIAPTSDHLNDVNYTKFIYQRHNSTVGYYITKKGVKQIMSKIKISRISSKYNIEQCSRFDVIADKALYKCIPNSYVIPLLTYQTNQSTIHPCHLGSHKRIKERTMNLWRENKDYDS